MDTNPTQTLLKSEEEGILPNTFYAALPWYHKPKKPQEKYRPTFLMNTDPNIFNKIPELPIQQHIKKIIHNNQKELIPGMQGWFYIKSMDISH